MAIRFPALTLLKAFAVGIGLFLLMLAVGAFWQDRKTAQELGLYPPAGKLIDVDGVKYHLHCQGTGTPTVVFEAGLGDNSLTWHPIQGEIAKSVRACSYDRAGLGWSGAINQTRSATGIARSLHQLLGVADIRPPYVLVGHSRGGIYVRSYRSLYPQEVIGMVLVDSTHENGPAREYAIEPWGYDKQKFQMLLAVPLSTFGIVRLMGWAKADRFPSPLSKEVIAAKTAVQNRTDTAKAVVFEMKEMRKSLDPAAATPAPLGSLPLIVLSSGKRTDPELAKSEASIQKRSSANAIKEASLNQALQRELVSLSSDSELIVAKESGHFIHHDEPELVISAIHGMLKK